MIYSLFILWMVSQEDAYVKNLSNCVKNVQFMIHQLHFDKTLKNKNKSYKSAKDQQELKEMVYF